MAGYILKIMLEGTHPPVWRRVLVPEKITFADLHQVIQAVFGWKDAHLHEFRSLALKVRITGKEVLENFETGVFSDDRVLLEDFLFEKGNFRYIYDFGDDWAHRIVYEKTEESFLGRSPVLLKAKGDHFAEDSGGVYGSDGKENRIPFSAEETAARLADLNFPVDKKLEEEQMIREEIRKGIAGLASEMNSWLKERLNQIQAEKKEPPSAMTEKIKLWKSLMEDEKNQVSMEILPEVKGQRELLQALSRKELKDYCKYLQIPTLDAWTEERLAGEISDTLTTHPEYLLYVFFEEEFRELKQFWSLPKGPVPAEQPCSDTQIKALGLGLMDIRLTKECRKNKIQVSFARELGQLFSAFRENEVRKIYRRLQRLSGRLGDMILAYGMVELNSFYKMFCRIYGESLSEEEFKRLVYWHGRFNNLLRTLYTGEGISYGVMLDLDAASLLDKIKTYSDDLEYKLFSRGELRDYNRQTIETYPELGFLHNIFMFSMGLPSSAADHMIESLYRELMNGCTMQEVLKRIELTEWEKEPLPVRSSLWSHLSSLMLEFPQPMLKGRSREEYAKEKKISPWRVEMVSVGRKKTGKQKPLCDFPAEVQEHMKGAENNSREDLQWLEKYRKEKKIVSEEYLYFLADQFTVSCDWTQARKLAEELEKSSPSGAAGAEVLRERIREGQKTVDDFETEEPFGWGFPWAADPELERQMPYVRKNPKIGRNDPCPCGSGKKYKHCCGK